MTEENDPADTPFMLLNSLTDEEKYFLQITALLDSNTPRQELFRIMKALQQAPGSTYKWDAEKAANQLRKLRQLGLIDNHNRCQQQILEVVARRSIEKRALELCRQLIRSSYIDNQPQATENQELCARTLRNFRLAFFNHDFDALQKYLPVFYRAAYSARFRHPYAALTLYPFDQQWFLQFPLPLQFTALDDCITHSLEDLVATPELDQFIAANYPAEKIGSRPFILLYAHKLLLSGRLGELNRIYSHNSRLFSGSGFKGAIAALQGDFNQAAIDFRSDLELARHHNPDGAACFDAPIAFFHILTLGQTQTAAFWEDAVKALNTGEQEFSYNPFTRDLFRLADTLLKLFRGLVVEARESFNALEKRPDNSIFTMLKALVSYWLIGEIPLEERPKLKLLNDSTRASFPWVSIECAQLLALTEPDNHESDKRDDGAAGLSTKSLPGETDSGLKALSPAIAIEPAWRRTLAALRQLTPRAQPATDAEKTDAAMRLAWFVGICEPGILSLTPKIQKNNADNSWSSGRNLALNRIYEGDLLPFFTPQDLRICTTLRRQPDEKGETYIFDQNRALPALAGHPHIFLSGHPEIAVSVNHGQAAITVEKQPERDLFTIKLHPDLENRETLVLQEAPTRFTFYSNTPELREVAKFLGTEGLVLPGEAESEILEILKPLSAIVPIFTSLDPDATNRPPASDDKHLYLQIFPSGNGLRFELVVKPLGSAGPLLQPGVGQKNIFATIDQTARVACRNLILEKQRQQALLTACPGLTDEPQTANWQINELEDCLQILFEIQEFQKKGRETEGDGAEAGSDWLICEWPAGKKISLKNRTSTSAFKFNIQPHKEWFKIEGEVKVDEEQIIGLADLLKTVKAGPGRFLPLADNQFIALTEDLRRRLHALSFYLSDDDGELTIHKAAINNIAELMADLPEVNYSRSWQEQLQRFQEAGSFKPKLPETLKTELRGYQIEGFSWLSRLAHLGFGACLADDMGLGKTVQTLALILSRAQAGPVLVVAPTSVCGNWLAECQRFAPKLNPILFGGPERQQLFDSLKPYDLLISSYTMLQQEQELFAGKEWEIIVLDEAQAIKNMNTKRSRSAMSLKGRFRLITTGTPMENHLGELWNLFNFINPGLLGSLDQFNQRFAIPIEQENNEEARQHLRKILKPYILRRKKSQVLKELPPRTEILLPIEMSLEERNFYEAVRRQAISRLEEVSEQKEGNRNSAIQVLAELTRLRLAACNPRLLLPESTIESAKLKHFGRIIDDLLANGHQALVFSQFVRHLSLLRDYLDQKRITYRYLDGTTPKNRRQTEISAFQNGEADLFLISLKAGGLGLNLTAADYVLHLDPWWNPAIEDQASDRAHRIGQTRPVTVYRLISQHTIEEKIVRLHQEKRNLADQILSASDQSARFSTTELLQLIKDG
ncbi:MAG: DEAD/DEAH box helicase [Deltaproteobacteria bacterium]|nr:DEAD/DEAH box helicase [Deltaproteobacteria bacterium]